MASDQKTSIPRVPKDTPMYDDAGNMSRTWILYFERVTAALTPGSGSPDSPADSGPLQSPLDFGGLGDGLTDDTAAVASAAALGYLWLPPTYTFITGLVSITDSDFSVFGGGTLKLKDGAGTDLLVFDGSQFTGGTYPGNGMYGHINGVTLIGNAANQPVNLGACLVVKNAAYTSVQDCFIYAGSGDGIRVENANSSPNADEVNIINNRIFSNGRHGIYLHSTCLPVATTIAANVALGSHAVTPASMLNITVGATLIVANSGGGNLEFVVVNSITGTTFTAIFSSTKTGPGITVVSTFGHVGDHVIAHNHCNYNGKSGIRATYLTSSILMGNNVLTNGTGISLDAADRCVLIANAVRNNKGSGVIIDQSAAVAYTDLVIGTSRTITSAAKPFVDDDAGLQLAIASGTGFTVQTVGILSVAGGVATVSSALGTPGSTAGVGSKAGFGRSKEIVITGGNQLHFNGVQTTGDELDVFHVDGIVISGNFLGDTDFTPVAQYGIQLTSDCTGVAILGNDFPTNGTLHGPLLAPAVPGVSTAIVAGITAGVRTVTPTAMTNITSGRVLMIQGAALEEELVTVTGITGTTFTATFAQSHAGPVLVHASGQQPYRSLGNINLADGMQGTQLDLPAPALNDYGLTYYVSDLQHLLLWIGTQWVFGVVGDSSGQIVGSVGGVLTGGVWHALDGTSVAILNGDGTTQQVAPGVGTTIAANVATGTQTVTPASMTNIKIGSLLTIQNSDFTHFEDVLVTAITGTTFTALFTSTKTGPGILVTTVAGSYIRR